MRGRFVRYGRALLVGQSNAAALQVSGECFGRTVRAAGVMFRGAVQERWPMSEEWPVQLSQRVRRVLLRDCDEYFGYAQFQWTELFKGAGEEEWRCWEHNCCIEGEETRISVQQSSKE